MKVRWKHDSLRLRVTPTELEDLLGGVQVSERFDLSDGSVWEVVFVRTQKKPVYAILAQ